MDGQLRYFVFKLRQITGELYDATPLRDIFPKHVILDENVMKCFDDCSVSLRSFQDIKGLNSAKIPTMQKKWHLKVVDHRYHFRKTMKRSYETLRFS